jgi:prepilin-type N-terminal cleavage/methylation domain-containing protein
MSTTFWSAAIHRRFGRVRDVGGLCGRSPELDCAAAASRVASGDQSPRSKKGFTLVELLVVVVVIGILAGLVMSGLQAARETAKAAKTRATIAKLHNIIMGMYESYRTRRVPINTFGLSPQTAALARLLLLRDIMRLEMPERMTDISNPPVYFSSSNSTLPSAYSICLPTRPALSQAYLNHLNGVTLKGNTPAELLYMIVTIGCRARGQFSENEIANDSVDGIPEFIDGWGHPIYFLRWAPGFIDSDIQNQNYVAPAAGSPCTLASTDHDPFDPMRVDQFAWRLIPLIYSAGPDGKYGIAEDATNGAYVWNNDTYYNPSTKLPEPWGATDGTGSRLDNLHNHRLQGNMK